MSEAPFQVGERAITEWDDGAGRECSIVSIRPVKRTEAEGGYLVVGSASEPCACCGHRRYKQTPELSVSWFRRVGHTTKGG